ncbi:MAG: FAD-dependent monooxygenase [Symploca sp. SIO1C4]|uniref:FAD-dependent monooxygenase n=1 Tax=Symploca sp. SIO1C4 TaxID=2607765 RepID=A0A6B3N6G6_9CYAN|nr:FAD-dependent monooxygenase [Symploca sp. SIO1C4]NET05642.1 FAD-dependent monooxygenase [Symploca sp. SIO2B6]
MGIYDVVVVGAGPVGLATAIGLYRRGIDNLLVIDQTRSFRKVGQGLSLLPNGLKAIKYLDFQAYEQVKKTGNILFNPNSLNQQKTSDRTTQRPKNTNPSFEWVQKNCQGQRLDSTPLDYNYWLQKCGEGRLSISWYDLQTTLRHILPQDLVKPNHRCINVINEPESGCVRIDCVSNKAAEANPYAHWTEVASDNNQQTANVESFPQQLQTKSLRAKLVIAADGINSTVRKILYANSPYHAFAQPEYSGFAAIGCREISEVPNALSTELEAKFFEGSPILTVFDDQVLADSKSVGNPSMILFRRSSGQMGYVLHTPLPLENLNDKSGGLLVELALQELEKANFPNSIRELVRISPSVNMLQRPYYIHRAIISDSIPFPSTANLNSGDYTGKIEPAWGNNRVVLIGDAAHGMPPFMGQGANQGLEDAGVLTTLVTNLAQENNWDNMPVIAEAFEKYERLRRPIMESIQEATLRQSDWYQKEWQEYQQKVYCRNFEQEMEALL